MTSFLEIDSLEVPVEDFTTLRYVPVFETSELHVPLTLTKFGASFYVDDLAVTVLGTNTTLAYCYCFDASGQPESGVTVELQAASNSGLGAYSKQVQCATSNSLGLVELTLPRNPNISYYVRRGTDSCGWVKFQGVDEESVELTNLLG